MNPQFVIDGLIAGAMIGLGAIGVTLTYSILRFANFAHGEFVTAGAYAGLAIAGLLGTVFGLGTSIGPFSFGWGFVLAVPLAIVITGALALALDSVLFARLRSKGLAVIILVFASFGAAMALRSLMEFVFTSQPAYFSRELQIAIRFTGGFRATPDQLLMLGVTLVLVAGIHFLMTRSAIGRQMRAVAENPSLARLAGIDVERIVAIAWIIGGGLAAAAGMMAGLLIQIRPYMGFDLLLPLFAAAILGGIGSVPGAVLGGLIVGLCEAMAVQTVGAQWRAAIAFVILTLVLLLRPQGLMGSRRA